MQFCCVFLWAQRKNPVQAGFDSPPDYVFPTWLFLVSALGWLSVAVSGFGAGVAVGGCWLFLVLALGWLLGFAALWSGGGVGTP